VNSTHTIFFGRSRLAAISEGNRALISEMRRILFVFVLLLHDFISCTINFSGRNQYRRHPIACNSFGESFQGTFDKDDEFL
jgi:hypothetical protein